MSLRQPGLVVIIITLVVVAGVGGSVAATVPSQSAATPQVGDHTPHDASGGGGGPAGPVTSDNQTAHPAPDRAPQTVTPAFTRTYGQPDQAEEFFNVITLTDGSLLAVGRAQINGPNPDGFAVKVSSNGTTQWQQKYGGAGVDAFYDAVPTSDGGALLIGDTNSATYTGGDQSFDGWAVKIAPDGTTEWTRAYGTADDDYLGSGVAAADGTYLLVGERNYLDGAPDDAWALTIGPSGAVRSQTVYGQSGIATFDEIVAVDSDSYIALGHETADQAAGDGLTVNLRADHSIRWTQTIGNAGLEQSLDAAVVSNTTLVINGYADESDRGYAYDPGAAALSLSSGDVDWRVVDNTTASDASGELVDLDGTLVTTRVTDQATSLEALNASDGSRRALKTLSADTSGYYLTKHGTNEVAVAGLVPSGNGDAWLGSYTLDSTETLTITEPAEPVSTEANSSVAVTYEVTNHDANTSDAIVEVNRSSLPTGWTLSDLSGTDPNPQDQFAVVESESQVAFSDVDPDETVTVTATVAVPANASEGNYTLTTTLSNDSSTVRTVTTTVSVGPQSITARYDENGNGIEITELLTGIEDFRNDEISVQELLELIEAWRSN